jgi:hypothetical protein
MTGSWQGAWVDRRQWEELGVWTTVSFFNRQPRRVFA